MKSHLKETRLITSTESTSDIRQFCGHNFVTVIRTRNNESYFQFISLNGIPSPVRNNGRGVRNVGMTVINNFT